MGLWRGVGGEPVKWVAQPVSLYVYSVRQTVWHCQGVKERKFYPINVYGVYLENTKPLTMRGERLRGRGFQ